MFFEHLLDGYEELMHFIAEMTVYTLELIGIFIIIVGSFRVLMQAITNLKKKLPTNIIIALGRSLALALEFKMGAEIVKTVIIHDLKELLVLGIVIALRAVLALLIHWEIKNEKKEEEHIAEHTPKE